ncbi:MAG: SUMF1/EgtB/PvdO family nonheme iron enzyme [Deltaproteobacteria bacterium]|nr:SUMF1/EgtB/PvdO family nonheme iron enzyme [Deltaproteobacteria bacterium]
MRDECTNVPDGTIIGSGTWTTGWRGSGFQGGPGRRAAIPDDADLHFTDAMTVEAWVRTDADWSTSCPGTAEGIVVGRSGSPTTERAFMLSTNDAPCKLAFSAYAPGGASLDALTVFTPRSDEWHHLAATFDRGTARLYVDGALRAESVSATITRLNDADFPGDDLAVGDLLYDYGDPGRYYAFDGVIDEVRLWNVARSGPAVAASAGLPSCPSGTVLVPAGPFVMGCDPSECETDEEPEHVVTVSAFCMDVTEVTNASYRTCETSGGWSPPAGTYGTETHPITFVTWDQAVAYCSWKGMRLPTEAEWEKAARGGCELREPDTCGAEDERRYPWGDTTPSCARANYLGCVGGPAAVGTRRAGESPYGLLDLAGNVWEWTSDWYGATEYASCSAGCTDPTGPATGTARVVRGGAYSYDNSYLYVSYRSGGNPPTTSLADLGFRCTKSPPKALCVCDAYDPDFALLRSAGFEVTIVSGAGSIPSDLSAYDLVYVTNYAACTPTSAGYLRDYVNAGGGVVLDSGTPIGLAGSTNLSAIAAWLGAGSYSNNNCPIRATTVLANPVGTTLPSGTVLFDCTTGIGNAGLSGLGTSAQAVATWSDGLLFAMTNTYGAGRVFYYATVARGTYAHITADSDTLLAAGFRWAAGL